MLEQRTERVQRRTRSKPDEPARDDIAVGLGISDFARMITDASDNVVKSFLELGALLNRAKKDLGHGKFQVLFDKQLVPFDIRKAQRLMAIAEHPILSNTTHASHLPQAWTTLYELQKLPERELELMIEDGRVHPDMERQDVERLARQIRNDEFYRAGRLAELLSALIAFMGKWPDPDDLARHALDELCEGQNAVSFGDVAQLPDWIAALQASCERRIAEAHAESEKSYPKRIEVRAAAAALAAQKDVDKADGETSDAGGQS